MEKLPESDSSYDFAPREAAPVPPPAPPKPVEQPVPNVSMPAVHEQTCLVCGFKMLGKTKRARCPECGAALDAATADYLQFSDTAWLRSLAWGALLIGLSPLPHIAGAALAWSGLPTPAKIAFHLLASLLLTAGTWLITRRDPRAAVPRTGLSPVIARLATAMVSFLWLTLVALALVGKLPPQSWPILCALVPLAPAILFLGFHLTALAGRIPNDGLAGQLQTLAWLMPAVVLLLATYQFFGLRDYMSYIFFCSFPVIGGILGIVLWAVATLVRLGLDLRNATIASVQIAARRAERTAAPRP